MQRVILSLALAAAAGHAAAIDNTGRPFAQPQQLVDIGGGRLNLHCSGDGPVTVVFDARGTQAGWSWHAVQPAVAEVLGKVGSP